MLTMKLSVCEEKWGKISYDFLFHLWKPAQLTVLSFKRFGGNITTVFMSFRAKLRDRLLKYPRLELRMREKTWPPCVYCCQYKELTFRNKHIRTSIQQVKINTKESIQNTRYVKFLFSFLSWTLHDGKKLEIYLSDLHSWVIIEHVLSLSVFLCTLN